MTERRLWSRSARRAGALAVLLVSIPVVSARGDNEECMKLCEEGMKHFLAHEYEEARDSYDKARKADPKSSIAQGMYGTAVGSLAGTTGEEKATWDQAIAEWEK